MQDHETPEREMSFLDHLEELRWHIVRSAASVFVFGIIVFLAKDFVFNKIILAPKNDTFVTYRLFCEFADALCFGPKNFTIMPRELGEQFFTHLKVSIWLGIIISFPYIFWEFWRFIKPGLYKEEEKAARGIVFICSFLFISGVLFGYFIIAPFAISFLAGYSISNEVISSPTLSSYVGSLTMFTIPTGITFELPVVVYFFSKIGLLTPEFMKKYRRHAVVIILVFAAIITPPDVFTQFLIGIPVYGLYELSILVCQRVYTNYQKKLNA